MSHLEAENPRAVVDELAEHARAYEPAPRYAPEMERWLDHFAALRRRLRRAIAAQPEQERHFAAMAGRHAGSQVRTLFTAVSDALLTGCEALRPALRRRKKAPGHWHAEAPLRVFPVAAPPPDRRHGATDSRQMTALKPLLDLCQHEEHALRLLRRAVADFLERGEATWTDADMLEWVAIGAPMLCRLDAPCPGADAPPKPLTPGRVRKHLDGCEAALEHLRQIEERLLDTRRLSQSRKDAAKAFESRARKAEEAIHALRAHLDCHAELNETAYWLDAALEARSLRGRLGVRADLSDPAEGRRKVRQAVEAARRLADWLQQA